jgi:hypothetical protein
MLGVRCAESAHVLERHMGRAAIEGWIDAIRIRRNDFEVGSGLEQACAG